VIDSFYVPIALTSTSSPVLAYKVTDIEDNSRKNYTKNPEISIRGGKFLKIKVQLSKTIGTKLIHKLPRKRLGWYGNDPEVLLGLIDF